MKEKTMNLDWINTRSNDQLEWLVKHLTRKDLLRKLQINSQSSAKDIHRALNELQNNAINREHLKDMSNAWSQELQRKKPGQKGYNFVLSETTKEALDTLAKSQDLKLKECLTELIKGGASLERKYCKLLDNADMRHKEEKARDQLLINTLGRALGDALNELAMSKVGIIHDKAARQALTQSPENEIKRVYENTRKEVIARNVNPALFSPKMIASLIKRPSIESTEANPSKTPSSTASMPATQTSPHAFAPDSQPTESMTPPFLNAEPQETKAIEEEPSPSLMLGNDSDDESPAKAFSPTTNYTLQHKKTQTLSCENGVLAATPKYTSKTATKDGDAKEARNTQSEAQPTSTDET